MRRLLPAFLLGVVALQGLSVVGQAAIERRVIPMPKSLKTVVVPKPVGIERFVKDEQAAIALGKALFWDMQAGSDGMTACATCHYHAGVDNRVTNQINPGANGTFDTGRPNRKLLAADFPFRKLSDPRTGIPTWFAIATTCSVRRVCTRPCSATSCAVVARTPARLSSRTRSASM
jgi:cytochrome c peroxidase